MTSLSNLSVGKKAIISHFETDGKAWIRLAEMGLRENEPIEILSRLPFGGNLIVLSRYGKYSLRKATAHQIKINEVY